MTCLYPKYLPSWTSKASLVVCGKCIVCRENRIKDWYVRLYSELSYCDYSYTVTLTYDEEHLPGDGNLCIEDIQKYFKRLRFNSKQLSYKFYYSGEYGEQEGRPHFHAIVFAYLYRCVNPNSKVEIKELLKNSWGLGNVYLDLVSKQSCRYVLDYLQKDYYRWKGKKKVEPFQRMSKSLGLNYLVDNESRICDVGYISVGQVKHRVPRYYRKKSELVNNALNEKNDELLENDELSEAELYKRYQDKSRGIVEKARQVERNIKQRKKIKRGTL